MKLIFEKSVPGRRGVRPRVCDVRESINITDRLREELIGDRTY